MKKQSSIPPREEVSLSEPSVWQYYERLARVRLYVEENLSEPINLEKAAAVAALDPTYFSKYFHAKVGITFSIWLRATRVRKAMGLFQETDHSVTEVAFAVGFSDLRSFQRAFKRFVGKTPTEYRRSIAAGQIAAGGWKLDA